MGKVVIVTGVPGTGKTTVCNELLKLCERSERKITVINFGTVMFDLSKELKRGLNRDDLRRAKQLFQRNLQEEAAEVISQKIEKTDNDVVVDTHMLVKTPEGYFPGMPLNVLKKLNPNFFVLIEVDPNEVLSRRKKDVRRQRDKVLEKDVAEEFLFSRLMAASCVVLTGSSVKIVKNPPGKHVMAAKEILKLLDV